MPLVFNPEDQEQGGQGNEVQQQPQSGGMISGSGSSGVIGDQNAPSKSGSYTNLRSYLDANAGAGKQMAQGISQGASGQIDKSQQQLNNMQNQFQQNVQAGGVDANQQMYQQIQNDPTKVDVGAFSRLRDATYQGPQQFGGMQQDQQMQLQKNLEQARQTADATQLEGGRQQLLKQTYGRPSYSQGEQNLDQLLIQAPGQSRDIFANLRQNVSGLQNQYTQAQDAGAQAIAQRQAQTEAARTGAQQAVGGAVSDYQQQLNDLVAQRQADYQQKSEDFLNKARTGGFTAEQYGIDPGSRLYNVANMADQYVNQDVFDPSKAFTQDEFARAQALQALSGQDTPISQYIGQEYAGRNAGGSLNQEAFKQALAQQEANYYGGKITPKDWQGGDMNSQFFLYNALNQPNVRALEDTGLAEARNIISQYKGGLGENEYAKTLAELEKYRQGQGYYNVAQ